MLTVHKLNGGNVIKAINTWAVAVLRYWRNTWLDAGWTKMHWQDNNRALHPRANVARLYLPRNEGGRGLRSAEETVSVQTQPVVAMEIV